MKEKRLTPAESFSLGSGARGALIARTGSLIASGGSAVCCWTAGCCVCGCCPDCACGFWPDASANIQSSAWVDARNGLNIFPPIGCLGRRVPKTARAAFLSVVGVSSKLPRGWLDPWCTHKPPQDWYKPKSDLDLTLNFAGKI